MAVATMLSLDPAQLNARSRRVAARMSNGSTVTMAKKSMVAELAEKCEEIARAMGITGGELMELLERRLGADAGSQEDDPAGASGFGGGEEEEEGN